MRSLDTASPRRATRSSPGSSALGRERHVDDVHACPAQLERHLGETRDHAERVGIRLEELGHRGDPLTAAVGVVETVMLAFAAALRLRLQRQLVKRLRIAPEHRGFIVIGDLIAFQQFADIVFAAFVCHFVREIR